MRLSSSESRTRVALMLVPASEISRCTRHSMRISRTTARIRRTAISTARAKNQYRAMLASSSYAEAFISLTSSVPVSYKYKAKRRA